MSGGRGGSAMMGDDAGHSWDTCNVVEGTMNDVTRASSYGTDAAAERVTAFLGAVYRWMFVGLGVTAAVAYVLAGSPALM